MSLFLAVPSMAGATDGPEELYRQGQALMEQGQYHEAVGVFKNTLALIATDEKKLLKAQAANQLAYCLVYSGQTEASLAAYEDAFALAQEIADPTLIIKTAAGLSEIYGMRGQTKIANPYRHIVNRYALQIQDWYTYSNSMSMTGYNYLVQGQLDSARWFIEEGLRIKEENQIDQNLYLNYNHLATLYDRLNNYERSIEYHLRCITLLEAQGKSPQLVIQYNNLALLFIAQKNLERAEEYVHIAIDLSKQLDLSLYYSSSLSTLALIREEQGRIEEALDYHQEALQINREAKIEHSITQRLLSIVKLYLKQGFFEMAENYFAQVMPLILKRDLAPEKIDAFLIQADLKLQQNLLLQAKTALDSAEAYVAQSEFHHGKTQLLTLQSQYFEKTGAYQTALYKGRQASLLRDSIFNLEKSERVHELEEEYERSKKEKAITLLNAEQEIKNLAIAQNRKNTIVSLLGLFMACGALLVLYYLSQLRMRTNLHLAEKNTFIAKALEEKEVLLKEIHHRVKSNLQLVSSLLQMQTDFIEDAAALDALQEGRNRVKSMAIIHQNLYQDGNLVGVNIQEYITKLSNNLFHSYNIQEQRIRLKTYIDPIKLDVDTLIPLALILNELLTNALKYAFPADNQGTVTVTLAKKETHLLLEVKDDGVGMKNAPQGLEKPGGFGLRLLETFAVKLKARLNIQQENGTVVQLLIHHYKTA